MRVEMSGVEMFLSRMEPGEEKNLNFHDGLLRYLLSRAGQSAHIGLIGRHLLGGNSEGHHGNSIFFPWVSTLKSDVLNDRMNRTHFSIILN